MEDQLKTTETDGYKEGVRIIPFQEVITLGSTSKIGKIFCSGWFSWL